jgi:3-hydroxybutyryl-CoA dehydratase
VPRYFEEYTPGELLISQGRTITETDVVSFAALTGDWNELHVNEEFARAGKFGRRIAHGALIFSISMGLAALFDRSSQPDLIAFYGVDRLRFTKPVFIGDTVRLRQTIGEIEPKTDSAGIVNFSHDVVNQDNAVVVSYRAKLLVRRKPIG